MKFILFTCIVFLSAFQKCNHNTTQNSLECDLLKVIFNEKFFYEPEPGKLMNIVGIDTITILDKSNYLMNCPTTLEIDIDTLNIEKGKTFRNLTVPINNFKKIIRIKQNDTIPIRIQGFKADVEDYNNPKFKCYFLLNKTRINKDSVYIEMEKFISNHKIGLTYCRKNGKWVLVDSLIGQY